MPLGIRGWVGCDRDAAVTIALHSLNPALGGEAPIRRAEARVFTLKVVWTDVGTGWGAVCYGANTITCSQFWVSPENGGTPDMIAFGMSAGSNGP